MDTITAAFFEASDAAVRLVGTPAVSARWDAPSILPGYTVGGLAAHLARSVHTVETYTAAGPAPADSTLLTAAEYFATALGDHDPVDSDLHARVRARGEEAAEAGPTEVVDRLRVAVDRLGRADLDVDGPVTVLNDLTMRLGDYLETRLVELAIHSVDLAESVDADPPTYRAPVWEVVARVVVATAVQRTTARSFALAAARPERHGPVQAFG